MSNAAEGSFFYRGQGHSKIALIIGILALVGTVTNFVWGILAGPVDPFTQMMFGFGCILLGIISIALAKMAYNKGGRGPIRTASLIFAIIAIMISFVLTFSNLVSVVSGQ